MNWYIKNPTLLQDLKDSLAEAKQDIRLRKIGDSFEIIGSYEIRQAGVVLKTYHIKIKIPDEYPHAIPKVFEIGSLIPNKPERHINSDGSACLFVSHARWEQWPIGSPFSDFLNGPVRNFFLGQIYYDINKCFPWGESGHGSIGIIEYYSNFFGTTDRNLLILYLCRLINPITRQTKCPCGKGKRFIQCHGENAKLLLKNITEEEIDQIRSILKTIDGMPHCR